MNTILLLKLTGTIPKFELGKLALTRALNDDVAGNISIAKFVNDSLKKYVRMDWGDCGEEDSKFNNSAIQNGGSRILAKYSHSKFGDIYIITEYDRSITTMLYTGDY